MNILFFDIECATCAGGGKLCEFGYVLTDTSFNVLERDNFLIDPKATFDEYVIRKMLHHTAATYANSPAFPFYYEKIKTLLTDVNSIKTGHTVRGDVEHIGDDCVRYGLHFFDLSYVDVAELYKIVSGKRDSTSLVKMCEELGVSPKEDAHCAVADAEMTMLALKAITEKTGKNLTELCAIRSSAVQSTVCYEQRARRRANAEKYLIECAERGIKLTSRAAYPNLIFYASKMPYGGKKAAAVKGKRVAFCDLFEKTRYLETLNLIRLIKRGGGKFTPCVKNCDLFMTFDAKLNNGERVFGKKYEDLEKERAKGKKIAEITFGELCAALGADTDDLKRPVRFSFERETKPVKRAPILSEP